MGTIGEGTETVFGDYKIRVVQTEIDRHISVYHGPTKTFVYNNSVPAGFAPLPGAYAPEQDCMRYAVEQALIHAGSNDNPTIMCAALKWDRGSFPLPELSSAPYSG